MFGRGNNTNDRPADDQRFVRPIAPPPGTKEAVAVTLNPSQPAAAGSDESMLAAGDRFEGTFRTARGLRVRGTVQGTIESESHVYIEEDAKVTADVTAEEVVIAGQYSGHLVCRQRLEILPTGRVSGTIETVTLMLHEGGYIDGELHMQKPSDGRPSAKEDDIRSSTERPGEPPGRAVSVPRQVGSIRSTVEPSVRRPAATSGGTGLPE